MKTHDMDLIGHFEELRKRLIFVLGTFILLFIASFIYAQDLYHWLVKDLEVKLAILGPSDILWVYMILSSIAAIAGTIPMAAYQTWLFVRPALKEKERKITLAYIPALFLLFFTGVCFGYFVIFPMVFQFLLSMSEDMFMTFFTTEKYFKFLINMTLPFGFLFELPVIIMFLTSVGVLNPYRLQKIRKYAYFILILIAIFITPPDFLSDILVVIPLIFLYECSVLLSRVVYRRKQETSLAV
ncbi:twin-arginine translocase subunit TatC [Paenibacillus sp. BSR1-1]|uniref:twin-arginine translocase subunit TatC n=1 Tax=Paenibacillus sp. BSR1-1 TaxID=3020845 RepID=UPI0025AEF7D6|nr:twin-arginine translocase subunit TatC [Paenibacillus sp. BSR1-1]MDN3020019.1 twin-arginine translocase subunit TatC [Paenibacillus sp. BSR1-1]